MKHEVSIRTRKAWVHVFDHKPSLEEIVTVFVCDLITLEDVAKHLIIQGETTQGGNT